MAHDPDSPRRRNTDLVLPVGQYAYVQDTTTGVVHVHVGPTVVNTSGTEQAVTYDHESRSILPVSHLDDAVRQAVLVEKGQYAILENPSEGPFPGKGKAASAALEMGRSEVITGPASFVPWPHQNVTIVDGHQLRSNQYALTRVYDADAAMENWDSAIMKPATSAGEGAAEGEDAPEVLEVSSMAAEDLTEGMLLLVKGTEVSYYIPPTGIEVVANRTGEYVRDAVTLERLEYCVLVDESGEKDFVRGPAVVFPAPTQRFHYEDVDEAGNPIRIFQPIELNAIQGVHLKFIADFKDTMGLYGVKKREFVEGEEVFLTGKDTTIFFPTEHVSFVKYDGKAKHYAVAVPAGEARYVMNRTTAQIDMITGPNMLLPNPVEEVIVRRALSPTQCELWYPDNDNVREYNLALAQAAKGSPSTRAGTVSEGQAGRNKRIRRAAGSGRIEGASAARSSVSYGSGGGGADEFSRQSTFTEPRTVTLGGRYSGVPRINVWTGFAVQVVDKQGNRRVVQGPNSVLLAFDEELEHFSLSSGKPKTTDDMITDAYLRVANNQVSDIVTVETSDHVKVHVKLSLRCGFTGEDSKWFSVDNYVKLLTDRVRSMLRAAVRTESIESFFAHGEAYVRDSILGKKTSGKKDEKEVRAGLHFSENGLQVTDVEVLAIDILDRGIAQELQLSAQEAVTLHLGLERTRRQFAITAEKEQLGRDGLLSKEETRQLQAEIELRAVARGVADTTARQEAAQSEHTRQLEVQKAADVVAGARSSANLVRVKEERELNLAYDGAVQELKLAFIQAETAAFSDKAKAVSGDIAQAIMALGDKQTVVALAEALKVQTALDGGDFGGTIATVLGGTVIGQKVLSQLQAPTNGVHAES